MGAITKEQWMQAEFKEPTEEFYIPRLGGTVTIRGITALREISEIEEMIRKYDAARRRGVPKFRDLSLEEIAVGCWASKALVEPKLTFNEVIDLLPKDGPAFVRMVRRINELSGVTEKALEEKEAALEADSFPDGGDDGVPGVSASPAE